MKKAAIILATYNERENIKQLIPRIFSLAKKIDRWEIHVFVVDSNSADKTVDEVYKLKKHYPRLYLIKTAKKGLGSAYVEGFTEAIKKINPYLLFEMDADLSHNPDSLPLFFKAVEKGADFVIGSRYIKGGSIPKNWSLHRKIFSIFGNLIVRLGFMHLSITDWTSGYRAIKVWVIKSIIEKIKKYSGYVFQIASIDNALKQGAIIKEVPINFEDRRWGKSKIVFSQYIFDILFYILTHSSFVRYIIVGISGFIIDFGLSFLFIEKMNWVVWLSTLISAETAIVSNFFLNNFWSFSYKKLTGGIINYLISFIKFNLVTAGALIIQAVGIQLAVNFWGKEFWYLYKAVIIIFIIIPYSYFLYNKVIWGKNNKL